MERAEVAVKRLLESAEREAKTKVKEAEIEAKSIIFKARTEFDHETKERRQELLSLEKRILQKEENLDRKVEVLEKKEEYLGNKQKEAIKKETLLVERQQEIEKIIQEERENLSRISGMNSEEAKKVLLEKMEGEIVHEAASLIRRIEGDAKARADREAKRLITLAVQRYAGEHVSETTVTTVPLPNDEMKGRIIGREGRNIRALEAATGIDVIIDDTPEVVVLSGFDNVRKEIARIALERLIVDGRIHPARIEEIVEKVKHEIEERIKELGEQAAFDIGVHGIHPEIIKLLGRLHYRTSYGQNVLQHSKETAFILGIMAAELGLDVTLAKRIGLLHDIGKAVSHEIDGSHATIGADFARRYREVEEVINAIGAHHGDIEALTPLAVLASAADAVSGARPGARSETLEAYIKRLEELEAIAKGFKGIDKAYAVQAGREIRVIVQPDKINEDEALLLARNITNKIQEDLEYPGQIKVTVIRETRAVEYAK